MKSIHKEDLDICILTVTDAIHDKMYLISMYHTPCNYCLCCEWHPCTLLVNMRYAPTTSFFTVNPTCAMPGDRITAVLIKTDLVFDDYIHRMSS